MSLIPTTQGPLEESTLARTVVVELRPAQLVVALEWRHAGSLVRRDVYGRDWAEVAPVLDLPRTIEIAEHPEAVAVAIVFRDALGALVSRSVWAITLHPSVTADALVGEIR